MMPLSALQKSRYKYVPKLPPVLRGDLSKVVVQLGQPTESVANSDELKKLFPHTYGAPIAQVSSGKNKSFDKQLTLAVVLSGGQAPGGHNVIAGLYDGLKKGNKKSRLLGALGGPKGLIDGKFVEITDRMMDDYRNTGGFDMIGSGRDKIEKPEDLAKVVEVVQSQGINGVVVVGGDDSNTNAAVLAEHFQSLSLDVGVVGCPKTIDGDLKNDHIETSFGFDTACKTYSELIGNIGRDANSAKKYWHFIKLMGRSASHITLECALQTQPNVCLIGEEVAAKKMTLDQIVEQVAGTVAARAAKGNNFGIVLIPEGLIEFIPEVGTLISQLSDVLAHDHEGARDFEKQVLLEGQVAWLEKMLTAENTKVLKALPAEIQRQLFLDRDSHGNVQVSLIETEKLLVELVKRKLKSWSESGKYAGKFSALTHFFGYEGRCAFPSNFDADYCYSLGFNAFVLFNAGLTGYLSSVRNTHLSAEKWTCGGVPITMMMNIEQRHGKPKPVIKKALVELEGKPFKSFAASRDSWSVETAYLYPGAIQYYGPSEVCDAPTKTLQLEQK
ncbi:MAG: diphosphate--fructose-6-phosphate 1-phosphotransferase [Spirochaetales bacterium]|nr:diphosphate--fructose-6-phosphate 1-phosphotransferase [Spirochaetales bacterium]